MLVPLNIQRPMNHEALHDGEGMEFCWKLNYIQLNDTFSEVHQQLSVPGSPFFFFFFFEGVKNEFRPKVNESQMSLSKKVWWQNYNRLQTWCNIGSDVDNGLWAIHGARLGCKMTVLSDWDTNPNIDFEWFKEFLIMKCYPKFSGDELCKYTRVTWNKEMLEIAIKDLGAELNDNVNEMMLFDPIQNVQVLKKTYVNPKTLGSYD